MKKCAQCTETKEESEFYVDRRSSTGRSSACKKCLQATTKHKDVQKWRRNYSYKRKYGITLDEFNERSEAQDHKCAICKVDAIHVEHGYLCVDHDHDSGEVRELLCKKCNHAIGLLMDSSTFCDAAGSYLRKHGK